MNVRFCTFKAIFMCKNTTEVGCLRCRYKGYTSFKSCSVPYTTTNTTRLKLVRTLPEISQRAPCSPYGWRARCTTPAFGAIRVALFDHCMSERHRTKKQLHCLPYDSDKYTSYAKTTGLVAASSMQIFFPHVFE